jgi:hypothetical protein
LGDGRVRPWWITAGVFWIIAAWYISSAMVQSRRGRWLVDNGIKGEASVLRAGNETVARKIVELDSTMSVDLDIRLPGREPYKLEGVLLPGHREKIQVGSSIPIWVNSQDPRLFTTRADYSLRDDLFVGYILGPVIAVALAVAMLNRRRLLRVWRTGRPAVAIVVDSRQAVIAPLSRVVRYTLRDYHGNQVHSLLAPNRPGGYKRGDVLWLIVNPDRPARAIMGELYQAV